jgi:hypothetical protein
MAMYAFRDEEKTEKVYAADFLKEHLSTLYFCPDKKCAARMQLCEREGVSRAYFRALPKRPHRSGCPFAASDNFHPEKHNEREFDFDSAMDALFLPTKRKRKIDAPSSHRTGESELHPLHTLREIYAMCKAMDVTDTYNEIVIGRMLLDERSMYMYPKGVFGKRIIEGKCHEGYFYASDKMELLLTAPIGKKGYAFVLQFEKRELWQELEHHLYENPESAIVVAGKWEKSGTFNRFCSTIFSKKQVYTNAKL